MEKKFDMFEGLDDNAPFETYAEDSIDALDIVPEVSQDDETSKAGKRRGATISAYRTIEEHDALIIDTYTETHYHPSTGEAYEVLVRVFKPEENPLELLKPAFAFSTQH